MNQFFDKKRLIAIGALGLTSGWTVLPLGAFNVNLNDETFTALGSFSASALYTYVSVDQNHAGYGSVTNNQFVCDRQLWKKPDTQPERVNECCFLSP
jgi:hypothetical protein